jgi:thermitase
MGYSDVASGIIWATDNGAKVVSMRLGANSSCPSALQDAVNYAWTRGVVLVAAAGNDGQSAVHTPANCTNVVPVGAIDSNDTRPSFSNYGPNVPISAPGVFVLSTYKDGDYMWMSGTSMSTPHVAGGAGPDLGQLVRHGESGNGLTAVFDSLALPHHSRRLQSTPTGRCADGTGLHAGRLQSDGHGRRGDPGYQPT